MKNRKPVVAVIAIVLVSLLATSVQANQLDLRVYLPIILVSEPVPTPIPTQPPEYITGNVSITGIHYDGIGQNEPDEYVVIENIDTKIIQLQGWTLKDNHGWTFTFPGFTIQPKQVCRVYTNQIHPDSCGFSFGKSNGAIWNNTGDCAFLRDSGGTLVSQRCY